jgi:hypothetical protein
MRFTVEGTYFTGTFSFPIFNIVIALMFIDYSSKYIVVFLDYHLLGYDASYFGKYSRVPTFRRNLPPQYSELKSEPRGEQHFVRNFCIFCPTLRHFPEDRNVVTARHEDVRGGQHVALLLTSSLDGCEWSALRSGHFIPPHTLERKRGGRVGLQSVEKIKITCLCWESNPGRPARTPSLYGLSYPGSLYIYIYIYMYLFIWVVHLFIYLALAYFIFHGPLSRIREFQER